MKDKNKLCNELESSKHELISLKVTLEKTREEIRNYNTEIQHLERMNVENQVIYLYDSKFYQGTYVKLYKEKPYGYTVVLSIQCLCMHFFWACFGHKCLFDIKIKYSNTSLLLACMCVLNMVGNI